MATNSIKFSVS